MRYATCKMPKVLTIRNFTSKEKFLTDHFRRIFLIFVSTALTITMSRSKENISSPRKWDLSWVFYKTFLKKEEGITLIAQAFGIFKEVLIGAGVSFHP